MVANVQTMMYVGDVPWHGLGTKFDEGSVLSSAEAIVAAGLNWQVGLRDVWVAYQDADGFGSGRRVEGQRATVRLDNGAVLGVVGDRYRPVQNAQAFAMFDPITSSGRAHYETAGALGAGERVWILAKIAQRDVAPGDAVGGYLLLHHAHDGSGAVKVGLTATRVVCQNTLAVAKSDSARNQFSVRHTESAGARLEEVGDVLAKAEERISEAFDRWSKMAERKVSRASVQAFIAALTPATPDPETGEIPTRTENVRAQIWDLYEHGVGATPGTVWGAYNAVTEYVTHVRSASREASSRLDSIWFGSGSDLIERAELAAQDLLAA